MKSLIKWVKECPLWLKNDSHVAVNQDVTADSAPIEVLAGIFICAFYDSLNLPSYAETNYRGEIKKVGDEVLIEGEGCHAVPLTITHKFIFRHEGGQALWEMYKDEAVRLTARHMAVDFRHSVIRPMLELNKPFAFAAQISHFEELTKCETLCRIYRGTILYGIKSLDKPFKL